MGHVVDQLGVVLNAIHRGDGGVQVYGGEGQRRVVLTYHALPHFSSETLSRMWDDMAAILIRRGWAEVEEIAFLNCIALALGRATGKRVYLSGR